MLHRAAVWRRDKKTDRQTVRQTETGRPNRQTDSDRQTVIDRQTVTDGDIHMYICFVKLSLIQFPSH